MNSDTARILLSKIFEKQSDNPYFPARDGGFPPIFSGAAVQDNQANPSVYDIAQALLANNGNPLGNTALLAPASLNHQNNLNAESQRIKALFEASDAEQEIKDLTGVGPDGKPKVFHPWSDEGVKLRAAREAKIKNLDMQGLPKFKPPFRGNHELDNLPTSHPGPPKTQVTPSAQNSAATGATAPQTIPSPQRGTGAPPFVTNATNAIADTLKSWGQSVTNNVTPKAISNAIAAPITAFKGSKPDGTSGTGGAPAPTLASKNDASVKAWYDNDMVRRAALLGLAGGAGLGGVYALSKMFNKPKPKSKINRNFDFTYPVERVKESEEQGWSNYLWGANERTPSVLDNPLMLSTLALAGGAGLLGGYKGTQLLTDAVLKKTHDDERQKAERDFHDALLSSYATPLAHDPHDPYVKKSSTATMTEVGQALDSLYSTLTQKVAQYPGVSTGSAVNDVLAGLPALYLLYAGASGLGTGALAYDYTRKGSKAEALKRALRERDSARYEHAPPELYATAEPVDISRPVSKKQQRSAVV